MRTPRIKEDGAGYYHVISRVVDRRMVFDRDEKERFRTTMRAVESSVSAESLLKPSEGWTNKFIFPPYEFGVADSMVTNLHLPQSSMMMMVSAFAVCGLEALRVLKEQGVVLQRPLELVAFSDEEGRFGGMFGSQALSGDISPEWILEARDLEGISLTEAMQQRRGRGHCAHCEEHANVTDTAYQVAAPQTAHREAEEVRGAHAADRERGEMFERGAHGQQCRLQTLAGQQDSGAQQQRCDGCEDSHGR